MRPKAHGAVMGRDGLRQVNGECHPGALSLEAIMALPPYWQEEESHLGQSQEFAEHVIKLLLIATSAAVMATVVIRLVA